jgi:hypothetical protein
MEKFKKVIELKGSILDLNYNKFDKFIYGELESRSSGDWNECKDGDEISYDFDLLEKDEDDVMNYIDYWNWMCLKDEDKVLLEDLKKYVGEGICYSGSYDEDNWYNVEFVNDVMVISFIYVENY